MADTTTPAHDIEHTTWAVRIRCELDGEPVDTTQTESGQALEWSLKCLLCNLTAAELGVDQYVIADSPVAWQTCAAAARTIVADLRRQGRYDGERGHTAITVKPA